MEQENDKHGKQGFWTPAEGAVANEDDLRDGNGGVEQTTGQSLLDLPDIADEASDVPIDDSKETTGVLRRLTREDIESHNDAAEATTDAPFAETDNYDSLDDEDGDDSPDDPTSEIPTWENKMPRDAHKKAPKRKKRGWIVLVIVLLLLVAGYGFGVYYFSGRLMPGTRIGRLDLSGLTSEQAVEALTKETESYTCKLKLDKLDTSVAGKAISLERDEEGMARKALAQQNVLVWPVSLLSRAAVDVDQGVKYDRDALKAEVNKAIDDRNAQSLSADSVYIDYDAAEGLYSIKGAVNGTVADATVVYDAMCKDIDTFKDVCEPDAKKALRDASIDDLPQHRYTVEWANRVRTNDIPILVNGEEKITADASKNAEWVSVGDGPSVVVDQDAVREWAESTVADAVFFQENWINHMLDVDAFVSQLSKQLATGVVDPIEAPMYEEMSPEGESREKAYKRGNWDSSLGRYIDVDLESQFARLFDEKGEVIWESAIVSGDTSEGFSTVTGNFQILSKQTNATLVGLDYNGDGSPDYSSNVAYWMPFYGGYGLHDATWRYTFGGETYSYDGSHGCVNLPYEKAGELFNLVSVGEQVYVHW